MLEATIFNRINKSSFNYTGAEIARLSGLDKSLISRFLNGKTEISVAKFFQIIRSMPEEFQKQYWGEVLGTDVEVLLGHDSNRRVPWTELIKQASYSELQEILSAIGERWADLGKTKDKELTLVR